MHQKDFFLKIYKEINTKNFIDIWFDFRISFVSFYKFNQYNFLKKNLTIYRKTNQNISSKFRHFSKAWWKRRLQAHNFIKFFFKKNQIQHSINLDYLITIFMNKIL